MAKHRSYSIEFKRRVAQEFLGGETLHGLARRHLVSRNLIRIWVAKFEAGGFDDDTVAANIVQVQNARIGLAENGGGLIGMDLAACAVTILESTSRGEIASSD